MRKVSVWMAWNEKSAIISEKTHHIKTHNIIKIDCALTFFLSSIFRIVSFFFLLLSVTLELLIACSFAWWVSLTYPDVIKKNTTLIILNMMRYIQTILFNCLLYSIFTCIHCNNNITFILCKQTKPKSNRLTAFHFL